MDGRDALSCAASAGTAETDSVPMEHVQDRTQAEILSPDRKRCKGFEKFSASMGARPFNAVKVVGGIAMFDLNEAIASWRRKLQKGGRIRREQVDELESHLRDELDQLVQMGPVTPEVFDEALVRLGGAEELNEEFSKVRRESRGAADIIEGAVLAMSPGKTFRSDRFIMLLLFIGFCGIIGWLGTTCWVLQGWTNSRHWASWSTIVRTVSMCLLWTSFFLIFAAFGLTWGFRLLRQSRQKKKVVVRSLVPAVVLSPAYILLGMVFILFMPLVGGWIKTAFAGPTIVQSVFSPDGRFEAYVIEAPSIDPPNQSLFIRRDKIHSKRIAKLPEDVDSIQKIHWSPDSDIVVFQTWFSLIAAHVPDYKTVEIPLGGEWHWRKNGTFWVDYNNVKRIAAIEFPKPGAFSYRLKSSDESKTVEIGSF